MRKILGVLSVLLLFLITAPAQIHTQAELELSPLDVVQLNVDLVATEIAIEAVELARYDAGDRLQPIDERLEAVDASTDTRGTVSGSPRRRSLRLYPLLL